MQAAFIVLKLYDLIVGQNISDAGWQQNGGLL